MRLIPYSLPLAQPYRWSKGTETQRLGVLVNLQGGWGEIAPPPHIHRPNLAEEAKNPLFDARVRCGHTTAQADAIAKGMGTSVANLLHTEYDAAQPRKSVQVNALLTKDEGIVAEAQHEWNLGMRTFKIKVGTGNDEARVAAVRDAFPAAAIRLDPNDGWKDPTSALERYEPYRIEYVEDPGMVKNSPIPIAADRLATNPEAIQKLINDGADAIILKPQRLGGPMKTLEAITICGDEGIACTVTNSLETSVGVHAALQLASLAPDVAHGLATSRFLAKNVAEPPLIVDGRMTILGTGIGVEPCL